MNIERSKKKIGLVITLALVQGLPLFLAACGQNAHVTRPELSSGSQVQPVNHEPISQVGDDTRVITPDRDSCAAKIEKRFPLRAMSFEEIRTLQLPYDLGAMELRTLGTEPHQVGGPPRGCGATRSRAQVVFAADLRGLPPRGIVARVNRVSLEMKLIRPTTIFDHTEVMCLVDERLCSGASQKVCGANPGFWDSISLDEVRSMNRYFVDQLRNESIWDRRQAGPGLITNEFNIDLRRFLNGSRHTDLESLLYMNGVSSGGVVDRTMRIVMVDDLIACSGEIVVEMEVDPCGGSL